MIFSSKDVAFGRHETFHLRFSWLSKGFSRLKENPELFKDPDEATVSLGVGKNMVASIRYWLRAARLTNSQDQFSKLGNYLFDPEDGVDPFMEDEATLWLVHWLIASNTDGASTIAWFFNKYHKGLFDQAELRAALSSYLQDFVQANRRPSASTQKNDVSVLVRLYAKSHNAAVVEDALDSPLSELGLIKENGKTDYMSTFEDQPELPCEILGFAIAELVRYREVSVLPLEELIHSKDNFVSPGTVFRLTESSMMLKIEELVRRYPLSFALRETAGLRQLYLEGEWDPCTLLDSYYLEGDYSAAVSSRDQDREVRV